MILTVLVNGVWQGALVIGGTALLLQALAPRNAATRYAAWFCALIAILAMPVLTATMHWGASLVATMQHHARSNPGVFSLVALRAEAPVEDSHALWAIASVWSAGALFGFLRLAVSFHRIAAIRRLAAPFSEADGIAVLVSDDLTIPIATGIVSPAIVLPRELAHKLTKEELTCTIEHELAHVRRGDVATNFLQRVIEALLFWNPWVYAVGRKLVRERECACDDWAASRVGETADYASCLATLARLIAAAPTPLLTPSVFGARHALVNRIERLTSDRPHEDSSLNYIAIGAVTMLLFAMTLLLQVLVPAPLDAAALAAPAGTMTQSGPKACANPDVDATAVNPAMPALPKSEVPPHKVSAIIAVTVSIDGKPTAARVYRSSGYPNVDRAVVAAAQKSTYSPKLVNCTPVQSTYLFKADFAP